MRILLGLLLVAHAVGHLPGFLVAWRWTAVPGGPNRAPILGGRADVGPRGIRVVGVCWLLAGLGVGVAAVQMLRFAENAETVTWIAVTFSSIMTIVGWPDTKTGAILNAVVIVSLLWAALVSG